MPNPKKMDALYMDIAKRCAEESYAVRAKVGCIIVSGTNIISCGWNGMPSGMPNGCEIILPNGELETRPEVLHAERNALFKLDTLQRAAGATLYITMAPCINCAAIIQDAQISRVVYNSIYRMDDGLLHLRDLGVEICQMS